MRKLLGHIVGISQMTNPSTGTGNGGDRCTETVAAMIDCTYRLGPLAKTIDNPGANAEAIGRKVEFQLTEMLNNGSDVSHLENMGVWFPAWLHSNGYDQIIGLSNVHNPSFLTVQEVIDNGHVAIGGFNDYTQLHLLNGADPYQWPENAANAGGHVLLIVGYDTDKQSVIVCDPLRSDLNGMPVDYSYASVKAAGFSDCTQITGPALPYAINTAPDDQYALCVDVSSWQGTIDWSAAHAWLQKNSHDGKSHVIMRASQDVKTRDADFDANYAGAVKAGIDDIRVYHYAYPQDNSAAAEAAWFNSVVGTRLRPQDGYMLDFEENVPAATDAWVLAFRDEMMKLTGREIIAYMNLNMVQTRMRDPRLAEIPLVLADWTFDPNKHPACPAPFVHMPFVQYSDAGSIPGISGKVDMDVYLGDATNTMSYTIQKDGSWLGSNGQSTYGWILDDARNVLANPNDTALFEQVFGLPVSGQRDAGGIWKQKFEHVTVWVHDQDESKFGFEANGDQAETDAANAKVAQDQKDLAAKDVQIGALGKQIDGLNHALSGEVGKVAGLENQVAAEALAQRDLEKQIAGLQAQVKAEGSEDILSELGELVAKLNFLPEVQSAINAIINKKR